MTALPDIVRNAGARAVHDLDVRPILGKGGDPFSLIMKTTQGLRDDEALHLVVGFEPTPLYSVMRGLGRAAHTVQSDGMYHVWFYRDTKGPPKAAPNTGEERAALKPAVEMDVRGLEPPQPMIAILEKLVELGPGAQLLVHHHREPMLLYDKLALRGYAARCTKRGEGDYLIRIAPSWIFEGA